MAARCTCEYESRKAWNEAIEAAAASADCTASILSDPLQIHYLRHWALQVRAMKKPIREPVAYREIEPPTYPEGLPGFLK